MSVVPQRWPLPAPQVAEAVAAMYRGKRERPLPVLVRDKLGEWLADGQFAGAYGVRGKPGWPPSRLALVTVFQMAEDLTDRQAAECVRTRIDWKYALGLDLADPGFDHSVLSEFRARVADGGLDQVVLDTLLERLAAGGLVGAGGKMRTDSTHVISAVRDLNRLELAGESVRACLEALAVAAPQVVAQLLDDSWGTRYGARIDTWRMPASQTKKAQLALAYGRDGHTLLNAVLVQWAGGAGPAGGSELQGRVDALRDCPAHEVAGFGPVADVVAGEPGVEVGLATGGQGESTGAQPAEQAEGGTHSLADHIELFRYYIEYLSPTGAAPRRRATAARRPPVAATETRGRP